MHAVRRSLLEAQAERLRLPLHVVDIPSPCPNEVYEARMADAVTAARDAQVERMVFGDLFLEDVRAYRERNLAGTGISPVTSPTTSMNVTPWRAMLALMWSPSRANSICASFFGSP